MNRRYLILALLITMIAPASFGQEQLTKHHVGASWGGSFPISKDKFMNKGRWISPSICYEYQLASRFSIAASLGYEYGKESGMTSDRFDNDLLDGYTIRQLTTIPFQAQVLYFFRKNKELPFQPYLGVGIGVNYAKFDITGNLISTTKKSSWAEIVTAQVGFRYALGTGNTSIGASVFWQHTGNGFAPMYIESQQCIGVRVGVMVGL